jgi:guanine nucleotide-binding protein subunit alpha
MCFGGREDVEAKRSREIDALIHRDEKVMQKVVKLLLLGKHSPRNSLANPLEE